MEYANPDPAPAGCCRKFHHAALERESFGAGTRAGYRVIYVAKFEETIYVLHCFQKKTQVTSKQDKTIAAARYRAVVNVRQEKK